MGINRQQPNFEKFKTIIYNGMVKNRDLPFKCVGGDFNKPHHLKVKDLKSQINDWVDMIDIRQVGRLVEETKSKIKYPKWLLNNEYEINFNKHGFMDLLKNSDYV